MSNWYYRFFVILTIYNGSPSITGKTTLDIQTSPTVEGMPEIQAKRFPYIDFYRFPLSTDKNRLIAKVFYRFRYNRYQSNQIYRLLLIYRLTNRYRFLSIDCFGFIFTFQRGEYYVIVEKSELIRLLESPSSLSMYLLITARINVINN